MKKRASFPVALMIWPYLILCSFLLGIVFSDILDIPNIHISFFLFLLLMPVVLLANILFACLHRSEDCAAYLAYWNMVIKLVHIPFYLAIFAIGIFVPLGAVFLFLFDAVLMLATSSYGISALIRAYKRKSIPVEYLVIHIVCHLLFVTDVISAILIYRKIRKMQS